MHPEVDPLARMFRHFADREFRDYSPVYAALAGALAEDPAPAAPLLAAPPGQQRAILLFAAVQYLLRGVARNHPLARYYPALGGDRVPDDGLPAAFRTLAAEHRAELERLCATRTTQTNEARRAALLRPGFGLAAATERPLALVELGTSAGLLLLPDRYAYRYTGAGRDVTMGRCDAPPPLVMRCAVRGGRWPEPVDREPLIVDRTGLDLNPLSATDPDAVRWLRSCVWPEQITRLARLDAALAEAATVAPRLVPGDMVTALPAVLDRVADDALPVVFSSNAVTYLSAAAQARLVGTLAVVGARRDLAVLFNEATTAGVRLFDRTAPPARALVVGSPVYVHWRAGTPTVTVLGETGPHGEWLSWSPSVRSWRP